MSAVIHTCRGIYWTESVEWNQITYFQVDWVGNNSSRENEPLMWNRQRALVNARQTTPDGKFPLTNFIYKEGKGKKLCDQHAVLLCNFKINTCLRMEKPPDTPTLL